MRIPATARRPWLFAASPRSASPQAETMQATLARCTSTGRRPARGHAAIAAWIGSPRASSYSTEPPLAATVRTTRPAAPYPAGHGDSWDQAGVAVRTSARRRPRRCRDSWDRVLVHRASGVPAGESISPAAAARRSSPRARRDGCRPRCGWRCRCRARAGDRLHAVGAHLADPVAAAVAHQHQVAARRAGDEIRMPRHRIGQRGELRLSPAPAAEVCASADSGIA